MSDRDKITRILRLAVAKGFLSESEADKWFQQAPTYTKKAYELDWLVDQKILTEEQLKQLLPLLEKEDSVNAQTGDLPSSTSLSLPQIPGYQVTERIGRGGMGVVYKAWQASPRRLVALKVMSEVLREDEQHRKRFEVEAQAAADLSHPGIVTVYEVGEANGQPYFSMEFVDGRPLDDYTRTVELALPEKLALLRDVCDAVAHAHERKVVHRDLKPANILVTDGGQPKVLDFGLAKRLLANAGDGASLTVDGQILGTLAYMAPEQCSGTKAIIDSRTDVYALGAILYVTLTGRLPHPTEGRSVPQLLQAIRDEPIKPPSSLGFLRRGELDIIIMKCLEADPARRYDSARELADDLGRLLRFEPIAAQKPSVLYKARKLLRRHRVATRTLAATFLIGLVIWAASAVIPVLSALASLRSDESPTRAAAWVLLRKSSPAICRQKAFGVLAQTTDAERLLEALQVLGQLDWRMDSLQRRDIFKTLLGESSREVRLEVAHIISDRSPEEWLLEILRESTVSEAPDSADKEVNTALIRSLRDSSHKGVPGIMAGLLDHPDLRLAASEVLTQQVKSKRVPANQLADWVEDPSLNVRLFAVRSIRHLPFKDLGQKLKVALLRRVEAPPDKEHGDVRLAAAEALAERQVTIDFERASHLLVNEFDPDVAAQLVRVAGRMQDPRCVDLFIAELNRILDTPYARQFDSLTAELFRQIGSQPNACDAALPAILKALADERGVMTPQTRETMLSVIGSLPFSDSQADRLGPLLSRHMRMSEDKARSAALAAICSLGCLSAVPDLVPILQDPLTTPEDLMALWNGLVDLLVKAYETRPTEASETARQIVVAMAPYQFSYKFEYTCIGLLVRWESTAELFRNMGYMKTPLGLQTLFWSASSQRSPIRNRARKLIAELTGLDESQIDTEQNEFWEAAWTYDETQQLFVREQ